MPLVVYDLESSIAEFFSRAKGITTRDQCDIYAERKFGGQAQPVAHQGDASYTVTAGPDNNKIVQFRAYGDFLRTEVLELARKIHPDFVSLPTFEGSIDEGSESGLPIYSMDKIPGTNAILIKSELTASWPLHLATVNSLAEFFAQSWIDGKAENAVLTVGAIDHTVTALSFLRENLPSRFQTHVAEAEAIIPKLESGELPVVFTHGDLNEINIMVDQATGKITGITNWNEAMYQPFGFALYGLENLLGTMNQHGWQYCTNAAKLREKFWKTFDGLVGGLSEDVKRTIRIAELAGILIRYGIQFEDGRFGGIMKLRDSTDTSWGYLDVLLPVVRAEIVDEAGEK